MRGRQASGSVAGSPSIMLTSEDEPFWDGDDMTLEMVTDVNDGEVDEDVRVFHFSHSYTVLFFAYRTAEMRVPYLPDAKRA